jgi:hypothetical protein
VKVKAKKIHAGSPSEISRFLDLIAFLVLFEKHETQEEEKANSKELPT